MTPLNDGLKLMIHKAINNKAMHEMHHHGVPSHLEGLVHIHIYAPVVHSVYLDCKICRKQCCVM